MNLHAAAAWKTRIFSRHLKLANLELYPTAEPLSNLLFSFQQ